MHFFGDYALPVVLFIIMIGIGLSTRLQDFKALIKFPKATILGLVSQIVLLPIIALVIGWSFNYSKEVVLGLLLLSLCPSGTGSNIITKMVKGNLALSVSLTTISSFKSLITIPLFLSLYLAEVDGLSTSGSTLPYGQIITKVFALTIIPTALGVYIAERHPVVVDKTKKTLKWLLPALLFGVFTAIMFFDESSNEEVQITEMIVPAILINVVSMIASFAFVKLFKVENKQALAISIESGLKNSAIGLLISTSFLKVPSVDLLVLAYSFISFYLTLVVALGFKKLGSF
jgi:BASS family bile acid:Na+ symporter